MLLQTFIVLGGPRERGRAKSMRKYLNTELVFITSIK